MNFLIAEYFEHVTEMEWAIEVALEYGIPVAATMCIGPGGDESGVGVGECAVRMAKAGALLVGVNCLFDPFICLEVLKTMVRHDWQQGLRAAARDAPLEIKIREEL